mmetsp:Transcript_39844/g.77459  ORF Transcript_39844/g.77459 Transcript_39844/m.77459 type:complete len:170 (-) Transcript_39844:491-1000(-)
MTGSPLPVNASPLATECLPTESLSTAARNDNKAQSAKKGEDADGADNILNYLPKNLRLRCHEIETKIKHHVHIAGKEQQELKRLYARACREKALAEERTTLLCLRVSYNAALSVVESLKKLNKAQLNAEFERADCLKAKIARIEEEHRWQKILVDNLEKTLHADGNCRW